MERSETEDPLIGRQIGSYVVQRRIGEGGMGAVYELLHPAIGRRMALKLLHPRLAARKRVVERFFHEARSVNVIGHPNIVDITDFSQLDDGAYYIQMEYLEGQSMARYLADAGPLSPEEVTPLVIPICSALGAAHEAGIVHRDLKPANVHLVPRPDNPHYVKVLDFGIAKLSAELKESAGPAATLGLEHAGPGEHFITRSEEIIGTPTYMSPEQAMGRSREVDHRTDIYALGIIMYQMLTGRVPFKAPSFGDLMMKHLQEQARPVNELRPEVPAEWDAVVQTALAKEREMRFQSMEEMKEAILAAVHGGALPPRVLEVAQTTAMKPPAEATAEAALLDEPTLSMGFQTVAPAQAPGRPKAMAASRSPEELPKRPDAPPPDPRPVRRRWPLVVALAALCAFGAGFSLAISQGWDYASLLGDTVALDAGARATVPTKRISIEPAFEPDAGGLGSEPSGAPADAAVPELALDAGADASSGVDARPPVMKRKRRATLAVTASPWARVYVDGEPRGNTPLTLSVPANKSLRVRLVNEESDKEKSYNVRLKPGKKRKIHWTMGR